MDSFEKNPGLQTPDPEVSEASMQSQVDQLAILHGLKGIRAKICPGEGWACAALPDKTMEMRIDPEQTINGYTGEGASAEKPEVPIEVMELFIISHELGHATDYLQENFELVTKKDSARSFFDCLIDDTVIDTRSRRIPMLDDYADDIYTYQMPQDLTKMPKHVQLMYALRIGQVVKQPDIQMDDSVKEIVDSLTHFEKDGKVYNIPDVLANRRIERLSRRRHIAELFILPHYEKLLEEDRQESTDGEANGSEQQKSESGQGEGLFDEIYEEYEKSVHGYRAGQDPDSENDGDKTLAEQIADAMKEIRQAEAAEAAEHAQQAREAEAEKEARQKEEQVSRIAGGVVAEMNLQPDDAHTYAESLLKWQSTIGEIAKVFTRLAAPTEAIMSPRYRPDAETDGVRLHPMTMANVALQLATGQEQKIWQPVSRQARRQEIAFGGLDVFMLCDVSGSMAQDGKAKCAADTALCLLEGLQLARYKVAKQSKAHQPDVRTQITAFGSDTDVLSELSHRPAAQEKGKTYINLRNPKGGGTYINGSLQTVKSAAKAAPERDIIGLIISDGGFYDHNEAVETAASMPHNVYLAHLVIGNDVANFISPHNAKIPDPNVLPAKLHELLANYIKRAQI